MPHTPSTAPLLERLETAVETGALPQESADLVLEALEGAEARSEAESDAEPGPEDAAHLKDGATPAGVHLRSITAQGFRGIGPAATLELVPGPGLTLVVGRNGSGKSSFAEALELLLTGDNQRWSGKRGKIWREGWANLHWKKNRRVQAELAIEGNDRPATLRRTWDARSFLEESVFSWDGPGAPPQPPSRTGNGDTPWTSHLVTHRPFLSYNELGSLLEEGPSKLYDALASILGLGELVDAADHLKATRAEASSHSSKTKKRLKEIRAALEREDPTADPRLADALAFTKGTKWKLAELGRLLGAGTAASESTGTGAAATDDTHTLLQQLTQLHQLPLPDPIALREATELLHQKAAALEALAGTDTAAARRTADLLEKAVENYDRLQSAAAASSDTAAVRAPQPTPETIREPEPSQKVDPLRLLLETVRDDVRKKRPAPSETPASAALATLDPGTCPVCKTESILTSAWRAATAAEIERLRERARTYDDATAALEQAGRVLRRLLVAPSPLLERAAAAEPLRQILDAAGIAPSATPAAVLESWRRWSESTDLPQPAELEARTATLRATLAELQAAAALALEAREEIWRPHARALTAWLEDARREMAGRERSKALKSAEDWLRATTTALRNERFAPIKEQVQETWEELRTASSVSLDDVTFEGKTTQRRIELAVTVDGEEGAALGVMSQGELHALALSLFLPRATLPQSPFRFVLIDDPVQAMDPARVDGLARVLARTAQGAPSAGSTAGTTDASAAAGRQVVVFTHDNRLPEAIRRLALPATILEVERDPGSKVTVTPSLDPVERPLVEARALVRTPDVPVEVIERVVPVLCREALEAAAIETVRKRRIGRGEPHTRVEDLFTTHTKLYPRLALALFDDPERAGDVLPHLDRKARAYADLVTACNRGAHEGLRGVDTKFVDTTKKLAEHLRSLR